MVFVFGRIPTTLGWARIRFFLVQCFRRRQAGYTTAYVFVHQFPTTLSWARHSFFVNDPGLSAHLFLFPSVFSTTLSWAHHRFCFSPLVPTTLSWARNRVRFVQYFQRL